MRKKNFLIMYHYYYIATDRLSGAWDTAEIENYLRSFPLLDEKPGGNFSSKDPFLLISLMKVKDLNSWSSFDYNEDETNYVSIITSNASDENMDVKEVLKGLEQRLCAEICSDDPGDR